MNEDRELLRDLSVEVVRLRARVEALENPTPTLHHCPSPPCSKCGQESVVVGYEGGMRTEDYRCKEHMG